MLFLYKWHYSCTRSNFRN